MVSLDRCYGNTNTTNNLSDRLCVPNQTEDVDIKENLKVKLLN